MPIYDYKCPEGHYSDDVKKMSESEEPIECPECGQEARRILGLSKWSVDRFGERFPYFDRGLGMELRSKNHRRQIIKERGLIPVEGTVQSADIGREARESAAEDRRTVENLHHDMKHSPAFKLYREQKSRGWSPNFTHRRQR